MKVLLLNLYALFAALAVVACFWLAYVAGYYAALDDAYKLCVFMEGPDSHPDCARGMAHLHNNSVLAKRWEP